MRHARGLPSAFGRFAACSSMALGACTSATSPAEPAADASVDAGAPGSLAGDAAMARVDAASDLQTETLDACRGALPVMQVRDEHKVLGLEPDWSCYEAGAHPTATATPRTVSFRLEPLPATWYAGVSVDFFFGPSTLGSPDVTRTFDADVVTFDAPAGVSEFSAHVNTLVADDPAFSIVDMREYGFPVEASSAGYFAIHDSIALAQNLVLGGASADPQAASIFAYARDCMGRDVSGARFELIDGDTQQPVPTGGEGQPQQAYVYFALPNPDCTYTMADEPAWGMVNAPANVADDRVTHKYRLRLRGRMHDGDVEPVTLGERELELFPGHVSFARLYR